ncbi:hypothetical protein GBAR_LOCUS12807 [Geodia barretti]|uniref:Uncharacterized protein n=1 Tax=Geodia barretti TaxID=519541 RepID=A0AA35S2Y2_GEOBA|nr:hypothetical protein GBAR_LOCUS12807 [Geodia barretti]
MGRGRERRKSGVQVGHQSKSGPDPAELQVQENVGDQSRSGQDPEELLAPAKEPTECTLKLCRHPRAYKWVQWEYCNKWFHCVCGGVKPTQAKLNSYRFKCMFC